MKKTSIVAIVAIILCFSIIGVVHFHSNNRSRDFSLPELVDSFNHKNVDLIVENIERAKGEQSAAGLNEFMVNAWTGDHDSENIRSMMQYNIVKITLADYLAQSYQNKLHTYPIEEVLNYTREMLQTQVTEIVARAILILARYGNPSDGKSIEAAINSNPDALFWNSMYSLSSSCKKWARELLEKFAEDETLNEERKQIAYHMLFNQQIRGNIFCNRSKKSKYAIKSKQVIKYENALPIENTIPLLE